MISYFTELNKLTASINDALSKLGITTTSVYVGEPTEPAFGEITTNAAFVLAKTFKKPPYEIAKDFLNKIEYDKENLSAEIHPSGFINFRFTERFYLSFLNEILKNDGFGEIQVKEKKKIIIEHTSVNPNKALHVGHARNVVLGDTFYRLFKRLGHDVKVLNYIDDTGVQVADLIVGFKYLGYSLESDDKFDHYCGDVVYVNANKAIEENEELKKKRSEILKDLEEGGEIYNFAKPIIEKIVREQLKSAWNIGARYDILNWESHFIHGGYWKKMFEILKEKGLVKFIKEGKYKNCWVLLDKKILIRSDGTTVYTAKDLTYAAWKLGLIHDDFYYHVFSKQPDNTDVYTTTLSGGIKGLYTPADEAYILIDQRQLPLQNLIKETLKALSVSKEYKVIAYGLVALSKNTAEKIVKGKVEKDFVHMSGRSGIYYNLDDLMNAIKIAAINLINNRNPLLPDKEDTASKVAIAAIRYSLLRPDLEKQIVFDIDDALKLEGDTGPYIQYTYARASKILEKANQEFSQLEEINLSQEEKNLLLYMSKYDYYLLKAYSSMSVSILANYAHELAFRFNVFYEKKRVLDEKDTKLRTLRLALVYAYKLIISDLMNVLGLPTLKEL